MSLDADTPSCTRFSVKSSNHPGRSRNRFSCTGLLVLRRGVVAGLDVESSVESCGNDVGDVLVVELEEPVDNPGTTIGTQFLCVALVHSVIFTEEWLLTTSPLMRISVIFAKAFQAVGLVAYPRGFVLSPKKSRS